MRGIGKIVLTWLALAIVAIGSCTKNDTGQKTGQAGGKVQQTVRSEEIKKGIRESKKIVVARVNGADITMFSLVQEMNRIAPAFVAPNEPSTPEITERVKKKALENLIFEELVIQEAGKRGIVASPQTINEVVQKVKTQAGSESAYRQYLEDRHLDEESLRRAIERDHVLQSVTAAEIYSKIKIDEKELRDAYERDEHSRPTKEKPLRRLSFEESRSSLLQAIKSEKGRKRLEDWEKELRKKSSIELLADGTNGK